MTVEVVGTSIAVLGKMYQLKCPENEVESLRKAADFLEQKMQEARNRAHVFSGDRIAILAALNIAHQFLALEKEKNDYIQTLNEGLQGLQRKIDNFFARHPGLELSSVE